MRRASARFLLSHLLWVVLASSGCSRNHEGPEVGDSVTNWLRSCSNDGECRGAATCIHALCSTPCSALRSDSCLALSLDAVCDPSALLCDLPCEGEAACSALGAGFACSAGRCRQKPQPEATPAPTTPAPGDSRWPAPVSAALLADDLQLMQGEPRAQQFDVMETTQRFFDPQATFVLDPFSPRNGAQGASWQGDHWQVVWDVFRDTADSPWQLDLARIYPVGRYELERFALRYSDLVSPARVYSEDGRLAFVSSDRGSGGRCSIAVVDIPKKINYASSYFQCPGDGILGVAASAVPDSDDWMLTWSVDESGDDPAHPFRVARYSPLLPSWSAGPWELHTENFSLPGVSAGTMSHYVWSGGGFLYRLGAGFSAETQASARAPTVSALPPVGVEIRDAITLPNGIMLLTSKSGGERSATIVGNDGARIGPVALDPDRNGEFDLEALYLPERNQVALCFTFPELAVVVLDERARQVGSPMVIATGPVLIQCSLAWSGSELLVTWSTGLSDPISARVIPSGALPR